LGVGLIAYTFLAPVYEAEAVVSVSNLVGPIDDEVDAAVGSTVVNAAASALGFEPDVSATAGETQDSLTVAAKADDPQQAADAANMVAVAYTQARQGVSATVTQQATVPTARTGFGPIPFAAGGALLGALAGGVISHMQMAKVSRRKEDVAAALSEPSEQRALVPPPPAVLTRDAPTSRTTAPMDAGTPLPPAAPESMADARAVEAHMAVEHAADEQAIQEHLAVEHPAVEHPAVEHPAVEHAAVEHPAVEHAAVEHPAVEHAAVEHAADEQTVAEHITDEHTADEQTVAEHTAVEHTADEDMAVEDMAVEDMAVEDMAVEQWFDEQKAGAFSFAATSDGALFAPSRESAPMADIDPGIAGAEVSWLSKSDTTSARLGAVAPSATDDQDLDYLDRRAVQSQFETARYELVLAHEEELAHLRVEHERQAAELRHDIGELNKRVRMQAVRLKGRSSQDQTRVGDLEAQVDALEHELVELRQNLETQRIAHAKRLTEERGVADRALDDARRQYRQELSKHVHTHRQTISEQRAELDSELAEDRAAHAAALHDAHQDYERQVESERRRADAKLVSANERHQREIADLQAAHRSDLDRQSAQHKETIESLRGAGENVDGQLSALGKENRALRAEIATQQKQIRHIEADHAAIVQRLSDEISIITTELDGERERNAALRSDVLRRSAEAHQTIDRAVEERTAQLAELEASVARQREYADMRVREVSEAAEEQARQAASREATLSAQVSKLKRELDAMSAGKPFQM